MAIDRRIRQVLAYIDNDSERDLSLAVLARVAAMSPFHFHRRFAEDTGTTVSAYVRRKRLERAAYDLMYTARPVGEIAAARGYRSAAAFSRSFRTTIGTAPVHLRSMHGAHGSLRHIRARPLRLVREPARRIRFVEARGPIVEATRSAWDMFAFASFGDGAAETIGLCPDFPDITARDEMRYQAAVADAMSIAPRSSSIARELPGGWYALFVHRGRLNDMRHINEMWADIYRHWPIDSTWELRTNGAYESYPDARGQAAAGRGSVVLHVPVAMKMRAE